MEEDYEDQLSDDELYQQALMLWRLMHGSGKPFASTRALAEKVKQLQAGLPLQDEFFCLCWWSGRCNFIHGMADKPLPATKNKIQVPDLMLSLEYQGRSITGRELEC